MLIRRLEKIPQVIERRENGIRRMDAKCSSAKETLIKVSDNINLITPNAKIADDKATSTSRIEYEAQIILDYSAQKIEAARSLVELLDEAEKDILNEIKLTESFLATKRNLDQNPLAEDILENMKSKYSQLSQEDHFCVCRGLNIGGTMVSCDNPKCPFGWFHIECVGLDKTPTESWFCPYCTAVINCQIQK